MAKLKPIPLTQIDAHPKNPRLVMRADVIDQIAAQVTERGFLDQHAIHVRPVSDRFEIIAGHHRVEAARKAKLAEIPAWVDPMTDDEAYMQLVLSNTQGELSPLERGIHFNGSGRGVREYARDVGRPAPTITHESHAADVLAQANTPITDLLDKTRHLAAIHALPAECWPDAVAVMLAKGWSKNETAARVKDAKAGHSAKVKSALFAGKTTVREVERIESIRVQVDAALVYDDLKAKWSEWFDAEDPVDVKLVQEKRTELEDEQFRRDEREPEDLPQIVLADPPWRYEFAETSSRQIENQYPSATPDEIIGHRPQTADDCVLFLWATVAKLTEALDVMDGWGFTYKTQAVWDKEKIGMGYWFRGQHEILLVGTKGKPGTPAQSDRVSSVFREGRGKHSAKPKCVYEWIEKAFPDRVKLEMYCRNQRKGWLVFGNESKS